jgi:uroporphyrinogen-III synthase
MNGAALAGLCVLVTRPAGQGEALARLIEAGGGRALAFPALVIEPLPIAAETIRTRLAGADLVIFISTNAVHHVLAPLAGAVPPLSAAALGAATAGALAEYGITRCLTPGYGATSEALLAHPALATVQGRRILIVRGAGGRETLAAALGARGALVEYLEIYRRALPEADFKAVPKAAPAPLAAVVSSGEALENLCLLAGRAQALDWLRARALFVPSARVVQLAQARGFDSVRLAENASDAAFLSALITWWQTRPNP